MHKDVSPDEVVGVLRKIIAGEARIKFEPSFSWAGRLTTVVNFRANGYLFSLFVDAGELDYIDYVVAPDGRKGDDDYWELDECEGPEPLNLLTEIELEGLIKRLEEA